MSQLLLMFNSVKRAGSSPPPPPPLLANISYDLTGDAGVELWGNGTTGQTSQQWSIAWGVADAAPWASFDAAGAFGGAWSGSDPATNTSLDIGAIDFLGTPMGGYTISLTATDGVGNDTASVYAYRHGNDAAPQISFDPVQDPAIGGNVTCSGITSPNPGGVEIADLAVPSPADGAAIYLVLSGATIMAATFGSGTAVFSGVPTGIGYEVYAFGFNHGRNGPVDLLGTVDVT